MIPIFWQSSQPPFLKRGWLPVAIASWAVAPTLLWANGFQAPPVNDPPFGAKPWVQSIVSSWDIEAPRIQARRLTPQGGVAVASQPFASSIDNLIAPWQSIEPQPFQKRLGQILSVDNPPISERPWISLVRAAWDIEYPTIGIGRRAPIPTPDDPPFGARRQSVDVWQPLSSDSQPRKFLPQETVSSVDNPPFGLKPWLTAIIASWSQDWPAAQHLRAIVQGSVTNVDNPPFGAHRQSLDAWQPEYLRAPQRAIHPPSTPDLPPFGVKPWLTGTIASWTQDWPASARLRFVAPIAGVIADNPPFGLDPWFKVVLESWQPNWQRTPEKRFVVQRGPDDPVFGAKPWLAGIINAWQPAPSERVIVKRFANATPAQTDNPPFGMPARWKQNYSIRQTWEPAPPALLGRALILKGADGRGFLRARVIVTATIIGSIELAPTMAGAIQNDPTIDGKIKLDS